VFVLLALMCISACTAIAPLNRAEAHARVTGSYIVAFKEGTTSETFTSFLADLKQLHNVFLGHVYTEVFQGFSAKLNKEQLMLVRTHPQVEFVEEDQVVQQYQGKGWCNSMQGDATWGLARISSRAIPTNDDYYYPSSAASDVDVYVIDTGIFLSHNDFGGRAIFGFKSESWWVDDDENGHGTHVSSTIGGTSYGVAKGVNLIAVKVLDGNGQGTTAGVIAGVNYAVARRRSTGKTSIGNMSLGGGWSQAMDNAVNAATNAGVYMVVAAGNSNQDACNYSPSAAANVITVGATSQGAAKKRQDRQYDARAYYSNWGTCVSLFAPGTAVTGAWIGTVGAINTISGTSMASPHVAGVAALFLDNQPSITFAQLTSQILGNATNGIIDFSDCRTQACSRTSNLLLFPGCESA